MKKNVFELIEESKKTANERYMPYCNEVKDMIDKRKSQNYDNINELLIDILMDGFYLGYAKGKREITNKKRKKETLNKIQK